MIGAASSWDVSSWAASGWPHLLLALVVIAGAAFAGGLLAVALRQPRVIGEVAAGIALGPSLLARLDAHLFHWLFPAAILGRLNTLAWAGVVLFVFFVGAEFELTFVRARARLVGALACGSLLAPLLLGSAVAFPLTSRLEAGGSSRFAFVLFLGVAVSITAFPVLAAILDDLGLTTRPLGRLALGTAALTDLAAWCLLALVAAEVRGAGAAGAAWRLLAAVALAVAVVAVGRPLLHRILRRFADQGRVLYPLVGVALALGLAGLTDRIGVSYVFGAFLAGIALGRAPGAERRPLAELRTLDRFFLLPVFFATTGLRIDVRDAANAHLLVAGALVLLAATAGKLGGVFVAARAGGLVPREAVALGVLLNTKGLTELVVLRIGYDLGVLSQGSLAMLIVVALLLTAATTPLVRLLGAAPRTLATRPLRGLRREAPVAAQGVPGPGLGE